MRASNFENCYSQEQRVVGFNRIQHLARESVIRLLLHIVYAERDEIIAGELPVPTTEAAVLTVAELLRLERHGQRDQRARCNKRQGTSGGRKCLPAVQHAERIPDSSHLRALCWARCDRSDARRSHKQRC